MLISIREAPQKCLELARENLIRVNPDLLNQYVVGRIGGLKRGKENVHGTTLKHWLNCYEFAFNKSVEKKPRWSADGES